MKRLLSISLLALALAGCDASNMANDAGDGLNVYRDALTGCEYLKPKGQSAALVPRLGYNGEQICRDGNGLPFGDDDIAADPEGDGSVNTSSNANDFYDGGGLEANYQWTRAPDGRLFCGTWLTGKPQTVLITCGPDVRGDDPRKIFAPEYGMGGSANSGGGSATSGSLTHCDQFGQRKGLAELCNSVNNSNSNSTVQP